MQAFLNQRIQQALQNEVAHEVVETMRRNIRTYVYEGYQQKDYVRTYKLLDRSSIQVRMIRQGVLGVRNYRRDEKDGSKDVAAIIETGTGYTWRGGLDTKIGARPFHQKTKAELMNNKNHVKALRKGLRLLTSMPR